MHIQTHALVGWVLGNTVRLNPRERFFCLAAGVLPDVDGLGILVSQELYWNLHHRVGHNVFFFALVAGVAAAMSSHRLAVFGICLLTGALHFAADFVGSGPEWLLHPWWPISDAGYEWERAWPLFSWQNIGTFFVLFAITLAIARWKGRTPLERVMPSLDAKFVKLLGGTPRLDAEAKSATLS